MKTGHNRLKERRRVSRTPKYLEGKDIILNLKQIEIYGCEGFWSSGCSGPVAFKFETETEHGNMEDPEMRGEINILSTKKKNGHYLLEVDFDKRERDSDDQ